MSDNTGTQALWPQMIRALAAIDDELGLPQDGCNTTQRTLDAIRLLKLAHRDDVKAIAGLENKMKGLEEICAALRAAMDDKRAFAICVEGRNGAMFTLHNCDDSVIAARMLERFARQQRADA